MSERGNCNQLFCGSFRCSSIENFQVAHEIDVPARCRLKASTETSITTIMWPELWLTANTYRRMFHCRHCQCKQTANLAFSTRGRPKSDRLPSR